MSSTSSLASGSSTSMPAGTTLPKDRLPELVDEFTEGVLAELRAADNVDAIHANYWLSGIAGHRLKHELEVPLVSTFHTLARVKAETGDPEPERRVQAEHDVMDCSDAITASCTAEAQQLVSLYGGRARPRPARATRRDPRLLLARRSVRSPQGVGLRPRRFTDAALRWSHPTVEGPRRRDRRAWPSCAGATRSSSWWAARAGRMARPRRPRRLLLADELGVSDRIRWVDPQPHHLLATYYRAADVCVVPSRSESFGLVALEAAACGIPVVAAAVGGLRTLVEDGETGLLVEERQPGCVRSRRRLAAGRPATGSDHGRRGRGPGAWLHVVHDRGAPAPALRGPHGPPAGRLHQLRS